MSFEQHLRDAIALNRERKPIYAQMSSGRSKLISNILILSERITLPFARSFDKRAHKWNRSNINVVTSDFVSMEVSNSPDEIQAGLLYQRKRLLPTRISLKIIIAYITNSFEGVRSYTDTHIDTLEPYMGNAMTTHILESIWFIATNCEIHISQAKAKGLQSPAPISRDLILLHLTALPLANIIDILAFPIQKKGVPIVINDIPSIRQQSNRSEVSN